MHNLVVVCVALACLLPVVLSQQQRVFRWNVHEYPDPFSYDTYSRCGRQNKSNICDPNGLVRKDQGRTFDDTFLLPVSIFRPAQIRSNWLVMH